MVNIKHRHLKHRLTLGQRLSDNLTRVSGSWGFILGLVAFLLLWMIINTVLIFKQISWDPRPYILLNLTLSCLAVFQAAIILMSQNRQTERDRIDAKYDYQVNRKAEREVRDMQKDLEEIKSLIKKK